MKENINNPPAQESNYESSNGVQSCAPRGAVCYGQSNYSHRYKRDLTGTYPENNIVKLH